MYYVYELIDKENGDVFYVGKGCRDRYKHHVRNVERQSPSEFGNKHLYYTIENTLDEDGRDRIDYNLLFKSQDEENCLKKEKEIIENFGKENLCNIKDGGQGASVSDETKEKIRKRSNKWKNDPEKVKEHRKKLKESINEFFESETKRKEEEIKRRSELAKEMWNNGTLSKEVISESTEKIKEMGKKRGERIKGKTYEEIYGPEKANKIKQKLSDSKSGEKHHQYGKELDQKTKNKISESNSGKDNPRALIYKVNCNGDIRKFETRKEVKEAVNHYNESRNLKRGEKIVYADLFEDGKSKSWTLIDKNSLSNGN